MVHTVVLLTTSVSVPCICLQTSTQVSQQAASGEVLLLHLLIQVFQPRSCCFVNPVQLPVQEQVMIAVDRVLSSEREREGESGREREGE